jgi:hypothetical protein
MADSLSRRELIKVLGAAGAGAMLPADIDARAVAATPMPVPASVLTDAPTILPYTSTTGVFIPPRGRAYDKLSYDFPEPSVPFGGYTFGFLVFTFDNIYGLDAAGMQVASDDTSLTLNADGLVWAGGQEKAPGTLQATFRRTGDIIEWDIVARTDQPIKTVTTVIRGIPRGGVGFGGPAGRRSNDSEILVGYPFSGGDLFGGNTAGGMGTPLAVINGDDQTVHFISSLDDRVGTKRFYFQPGEDGYRVEAIAEADGWKRSNRYAAPRWRIGKVADAGTAVQMHYQHLEQAFHLQPWETRADAPDWMRNLALVVTLHGQHYSGYIFNDYARMLEILQWIGGRIPGNRVMAFISAWDGRYYWDYPGYRVSDRMGGDAGWRRLVDGAHQLGVKVLPMFGTNAANRKHPSFKQFANAATAKVDGDVMDLNWVDWDNDRHQEGWLAYMNLGVDSWRHWLEGRIDEMISRYGVDAYFLDIAGGYVNNTGGDMHEGIRRLVLDLRRKYPHVPCVGEMPYDGLMEFIPMFQVGLGTEARKYCRNFEHLSTPAPGRGSSGVHESGFSTFNTTTLSLSPYAIPTLQVVDDTFEKYRDVMQAVVDKARERAGMTG